MYQDVGQFDQETYMFSHFCNNLYLISKEAGGIIDADVGITNDRDNCALGIIGEVNCDSPR